MGKEGEALDLFVVGQLLLEGVDALHHHLIDLLVLAEVFAAFELDAVLTGVLFQ